MISCDAMRDKYLFIITQELFVFLFHVLGV